DAAGPDQRVTFRDQGRPAQLWLGEPPDSFGDNLNLMVAVDQSSLETSSRKRMTLSTTTISTRRFCRRPSDVLPAAGGLEIPKPRVSMTLRSMPAETR